MQELRRLLGERGLVLGMRRLLPLRHDGVPSSVPSTVEHYGFGKCIEERRVDVRKIVGLQGRGSP